MSDNGRDRAAADLLIDQRGPVMLVTINRPTALNALTLAMAERLEPLLAEWGEDPSVPKAGKEKKAVWVVFHASW